MTINFKSMGKITATPETFLKLSQILLEASWYIDEYYSAEWAGYLHDICKDSEEIIKEVQLKEFYKKVRKRKNKQILSREIEVK